MPTNLADERRDREVRSLRPPTVASLISAPDQGSLLLSIARLTARPHGPRVVAPFNIGVAWTRPAGRDGRDRATHRHQPHPSQWLVRTFRARDFLDQMAARTRNGDEVPAKGEHRHGLRPGTTLVRELFADSAYAGSIFHTALGKVMPNLKTEIVRRSDRAKGFVPLPKRWIVERTIAWLNRCRRLAKDWENLNRSALDSANSCRESVWRGQRLGRDFRSRRPVPRDRDWPPPRLLRQSPGKLKTILTALGNRSCAGLRGGGRTPPRPVSKAKFPDNREINREFFDFGPTAAIFTPNRQASSIA
jgi:transposase